MKIIFYGGRQAGMVALLTLLAKGEKVVCVIPVDEIVEKTAKSFQLNVKKAKNINNKKFVNYLHNLKPDLFISCHGRQILKKEILSIGCINLHPCLYKYKGADSIKRLLLDNNKKASVGAHWMTKEIDGGKVILEKFLKIKGSNVIEVYNELYPVYSQVLIEVLKRVKN
ncbi:MAG: formyltransferase family protein [bacterium]